MSRRQFLKVALVATAGSVCAYPWLAEHRLLRVNRYRLPIPHLPEAFRGFTIAQVTDMHLGPMVSERFLGKVIKKANGLGADAIVLTGDHVHGRGTRASVERAWELLSPLAAPAGVHAVLGNHDYGQKDCSKQLLSESGWSLHGKVLPLRRDGQTLWLVGAGDFWRENLPLDPLLEKLPKKDCRIVLAHNPDTADSTEHERTDLFISGHTHGGQVYIPFIGTPVLPVNNKAYSSGLKHSLRGESVFICRGIGWSILPVRFLCTPELAVLELVPAEDREASA